LGVASKQEQTEVREETSAQLHNRLLTTHVRNNGVPMKDLDRIHWESGGDNCRFDDWKWRPDREWSRFFNCLNDWKHSGNGSTL